MFLGSLFIIIGVVYLLKNLGILTQEAWGIIWPLFFVVVGAYMVYKHHRVQIWREKIWRKLE